MGIDIGHLAARAPGSAWQVDAAQLLEEHHLAAWAHVEAHRTRFGSELATYLGRLDDTQVCELPGSAITDIFSFCNFLERSIQNGRVRRSIDARGGIVDALRSVSDRARNFKRRFIIWHDADVLLRHDHKLFGRLADAMMGVSAELEYASEDLLLIQRVVFVGAPSLDLYAEDPRGQFRRWYAERNEEPLWKTVTGVSAPRVLRYRIDPNFDEHEELPLPELKVSRPRSGARKRR